MRILFYWRCIHLGGIARQAQTIGFWHGNLCVLWIYRYWWSEDDDERVVFGLGTPKRQNYYYYCFYCNIFNNILLFFFFGCSPESFSHIRDTCSRKKTQGDAGNVRCRFSQILSRIQFEKGVAAFVCIIIIIMRRKFVAMKFNFGRFITEKRKRWRCSSANGGKLLPTNFVIWLLSLFMFSGSIENIWGF